MNRVNLSATKSPHLIASLGVALYYNGGHVGLLYRVVRQEIAFLHLGGRNDLRSDAPPDAIYCWIEPEIPPARAMAIAAFCRRIWKQSQGGKIVYGFGRSGHYFDLSSGRITRNAKVGLTCASFVLEVFDSAGFPLVINDTWPRPSENDIEKQKALFSQIIWDKDQNDDERAAVEAEIGNVRYSPMQVAGASTGKPLPASYSYASAVAAQIANVLPKARTA